MTILNLLALLLCLSLVTTLTVKDFRPALFSSSKASGFYNVDTGSPNSGQILAFVDLNGDKYTDYLATQNRSSTILLYYHWQQDVTSFEVSQLTIVPPTSSTLKEIMPCDVNADALTDLVITYLVNNTYTSQIYSSKCNPSCVLTQWTTDLTLLSDMEALPFIFDRYSNGSVSIFTFKNNQRTIVTANPFQNTIYSQQWSQIVTNPPTSFEIANKHFAAMVDINGDCSSDIVLLSGLSNGYLEIYTKRPNNLYTYEQISLNLNVSWLTFADLDANGAIDIFIIAYEQHNYNPYVLTNAYHPEDLCQLYEHSSYPLSNLAPITLPNNYKLLADSNIQIADFNLDGLPDLLGIFSVSSYRSVTILANHQGIKFQALETDLSALTQVINPIQALLYDFSQQGKLSVLIISEANKSDGSIGLPRYSIINNLIEDTLFIKVLPLLPSSSGDFRSTALTAAVGVTIQWRFTNLNGDKTISSASQKTQWNYGVLQLPFATHGLGRTNNYIQDLTVGYSGSQVQNSWTPVIPNSQLILVPQQQWVLQTLLKDNSRVYDMIYISILCLLGLGILIIFLNWRQTQEDKRDHYNFIQMIR